MNIKAAKWSATSGQHKPWLAADLISLAIDATKGVAMLAAVVLPSTFILQIIIPHWEAL